MDLEQYMKLHIELKLVYKNLFIQDPNLLYKQILPSDEFGNKNSQFFSGCGYFSF